MIIIFNDGSELSIDTVQKKDGQLLVSSTSTSAEMLRERFSDGFCTELIRVKNDDKEEVYEGFTELKKIELYPNGRVVAYLDRDKAANAKDAAFLVVQMQAQNLTDEQALLVSAIYPEWATGTAYAKDYKVTHDSVLYKCLQAHTSQDGWTPDVAPSLWAKVLIENQNDIPEWEQPESTNPYSKGDKVTHNGETWESTIDGNVWEPGVYGWDTV